MPPLSLMIKPASSNCNLRCKYCFYHSIAENRVTESYGIMSTDTLEEIVKKALQYADNVCTFAFQGGEPTLVGLEFYKNLLELQKKYNNKGIKINNALQTNGIAIDADWAKFLAENNFLVGLSLDGPKDIHDNNRYDAAGSGAFTKVMNTVELFNRYDVQYNILAVVTSGVARHIGKVYSFFKKNGFTYLQFIPCLDPLDTQSGIYEYSLKPDRYSHFLKTLFDLWFEDVLKGNMVSIRYFENLVDMIAGYNPELCGMMGICTANIVFEANGGTYPCDFYVTDNWYLGNIKDSTFGELISSESAKRFSEVSKHVDSKCSSCKWFRLCRGGCRRTREPFLDEKPVLNYYCAAYMEFFEYSFSRLYHLAKVFSRR